MNRKRRQRRREAQRPQEESNLPAGAIPADPDRQTPNNSYTPPPRYYVDREFECVDCGRREIWTATQQKWYYEVAGGSLYATAVRCHACRQSAAEQVPPRGDPNPIKHVGALIKRIRVGIEPDLFAAGFQLESRSDPTDPLSAWIGYARPGLSLHCGLDTVLAGLTAETIDGAGNCQAIASVALESCRSSSELLERIAEFVTAVRESVRAMS